MSTPAPLLGAAPLPDAAPLLEVDGFSVRLGTIPVVSELCFTVAPGERVGLIGESGSGKSVAALGILGLLPEGMTSVGTVRLDGEDLIGSSDRRLSELRGNRIAMVFQEPMSALNPTMRVGKQVAEVLRTHERVSRAAAAERAVTLLQRVGLDAPAEQSRAFPHQLSGGQRQRVMLAMAVACRPSLLLADEPTTALDVTVQAQVLALLRQLVDEDRAALVLISHDLAVISDVCDRVLVMYGGRIVESGATDALLAGPKHPYTGGLVATSAAVSPDRARDGRPLPAVAGTVPELGRFPSGCPFRSRCERATERCSEVPPLAATGDGGAGSGRGGGAGSGGAARLVACWHPLGEEQDAPREPARAAKRGTEPQ